MSEQSEEDDSSALTFLHELIQNTDSTLGQIQLCARPARASPHISVEDMEYAFGRIGSWDENDGEALPDDGTSAVRSDADARQTTMLALERRLQIRRICFAGYHFAFFPNNVVARSFANLTYVDIRQNPLLECVGSIVHQLPMLESLHLSACRSLRTLAPLADVPADSVRLKHLWVTGADFSSVPESEWDGVFRKLGRYSSGPFTRLTLSWCKLPSLPESVVHLQHLTHLFADGNGVLLNSTEGQQRGPMHLPEHIFDAMPSLTYVSLASNGLVSLPSTMARLTDACKVHLHANPELTRPPPGPAQRSVVEMRRYFHTERMRWWRGSVSLAVLLRRARLRANERLYVPGGIGFHACMERFKKHARVSAEKHARGNVESCAEGSSLSQEYRGSEYGCTTVVADEKIHSSATHHHKKQRAGSIL